MKTEAEGWLLLIPYGGAAGEPSPRMTWTVLSFGFKTVVLLFDLRIWAKSGAYLIQNDPQKKGVLQRWYSGFTFTEKLLWSWRRFEYWWNHEVIPMMKNVGLASARRFLMVILTYWSHKMWIGQLETRVNVENPNSHLMWLVNIL
jgi:hypothetical protein